MYKRILALICATGLLMLTGCASKPKTTEDTAEPTEPKTEATETVNEDIYKNTVNFTIEMEDGGIMKGVLYPDVAPETVKNFISLCDKDFYKGLIFHRVIPGFMIQGGGYDKDMQEKPCDSIKGEFKSNGFENPLKHEKGVLSMARTNDPDSASSQFFIMHDSAPYLDGEYAAFGKVTEGLDIIDEIATVETTTVQSMFENCPVEPQIIKTIKIEK